MTFFLLLLAALSAAAIVATVVVALRDGYRRVPERPDPATLGGDPWR